MEIPSDIQKSRFVIMYFRDQSSVRTLSFSRLQKRFMVFMIVLLCAGFSLSIAMNIVMNQQLHRSHNSFVDSQRLLFEYQSQIDGIYEHIYPHLHARVDPNQNMAHQASSQEDENSLNPSVSESSDDIQDSGS